MGGSVGRVPPVEPDPTGATIGVLRPRDADRRVGLVPDDVRHLAAAGWTVGVEAGAGARSLILDDAFQDAGAHVVPEALGAAVVVCTSEPTLRDVLRLRPGATLLAPGPRPRRPCVSAGLAARGVTAISVDDGPPPPRTPSWDLEAPSIALSHRVVRAIPPAPRQIA